MNSYLMLKFANELDETLQLRVDNIKNGLTDEVVKAAIVNIAESNALQGKKGTMTKAVEAKVVETTYTEFNIA
ncbi:DUF2922 domain-containing protein [Miniphocaeibacter halophilus]|uniref:DUF2922 domain-containing protein n=1 Tax=Miniphocaeibacter halophilus TaxID=2931922 RepID=A0AC61MTQ9_9FIRM|nr:DUF2922 domain-containing protein [Miniphocaeibacter halophilus]QQK08219.1 DUF2922 domain-containing protein [Miniphocaeibacter halophilus]